MNREETRFNNGNYDLRVLDATRYIYNTLILNNHIYNSPHNIRGIIIRKILYIISIVYFNKFNKPLMNEHFIKDGDYISLASLENLFMFDAVEGCHLDSVILKDKELENELDIIKDQIVKICKMTNPELNKIIFSKLNYRTKPNGKVLISDQDIKRINLLIINNFNLENTEQELEATI